MQWEKFQSDLNAVQDFKNCFLLCAHTCLLKAECWLVCVLLQDLRRLLACHRLQHSSVRVCSVLSGKGCDTGRMI